MRARKEGVEKKGKKCQEAHKLCMITGHAIAALPGIYRSGLSDGILEDEVEEFVGE